MGRKGDFRPRAGFKNRGEGAGSGHQAYVDRDTPNEGRIRRCVVEDDAAVRGNDRVGQERHRSVISGDDAVAWNVVTALSNPLRC